MAEQALNIGCKSPLKKTWTDERVIDASLNISLSFLKRKKELLNKKTSKLNYFIGDYLKQPCIPEILANSFCYLGKNNSLQKILSPLEAFQTYAVSLYDLIEDNHQIKDNDFTVLGRYGIEKTNYLKVICEKTYKQLAKELSLIIPNANKIAQEQYELTLQADKIRNSPIILSAQDAITLQDKLAGIPSEKIAFLSGGYEIKQLAKSIGNALSTIDDLIDLITMEDLGKSKTTIPLAYLFQENPKILTDSPEKARDYFLKSDALKKTTEYLDKELNKAGLMLKVLDPKEQDILSLYREKMQEYLRKIEND